MKQISKYIHFNDSIPLLFQPRTTVQTSCPNFHHFPSKSIYDLSLPIPSIWSPHIQAIPILQEDGRNIAHIFFDVCFSVYSMAAYLLTNV